VEEHSTSNARLPAFALAVKSRCNRAAALNDRCIRFGRRMRVDPSIPVHSRDRETWSCSPARARPRCQQIELMRQFSRPCPALIDCVLPFASNRSRPPDLVGGPAEIRRQLWINHFSPRRGFAGPGLSSRPGTTSRNPTPAKRSPPVVLYSQHDARAVDRNLHAVHRRHAA